MCGYMDAYFPDDDYGELVRRLKEEFDEGSVAGVAFLAMRPLSWWQEIRRVELQPTAAVVAA